MESVSDILGGSQLLLHLEVDPQLFFESYLSEEHRTFLHILRTIEEDSPLKDDQPIGGRGRPKFGNTSMMRFFLAKSFFRIDADKDMIKRLQADSSLKQICRFSKVPKAATVSRYRKAFSRIDFASQIHYHLVRKYREGTVCEHISRDSTMIPAREKAKNRKKDVQEKPKRKRGRPKKTDPVIPKEPGVLEKQYSAKSSDGVKLLNQNCSWGGKKNSKGKIEYTRGYKLHLDTDDIGLIISALVTGANVHDSQVALPLEKLTERTVDHLYSVMDAAYDAQLIKKYCEKQGRKALIDPNKRRGGEVREMNPAEKERYKVRSGVERSNAHLKDWLFPSKLLIKGYKKINFTLMCGILCLNSMKILQYFILPSLAAAS